MIWLCVNKDESELISPTKPVRTDICWECYSENVAGWLEDYSMTIPKGTIKKLINKNLTWEDEPVEL